MSSKHAPIHATCISGRKYTKVSSVLKFISHKSKTCEEKKNNISMFLIKPLNKFQKIFVIFGILFENSPPVSSPSRCFPMSLSLILLMKNGRDWPSGEGPILICWFKIEEGDPTAVQTVLIHQLQDPFAKFCLTALSCLHSQIFILRQKNSWFNPCR